MAPAGRGALRFVIGRSSVARQGDGTTVSPVAWDHVSGVFSVGVGMIAGVVAVGQGGGRRVGRWWVFGVGGRTRRRGRARGRRTGGGRWRTGRGAGRP